ncbi:MAG: CoA-binding protein, partial [Actinomycetota bacterium]|nr:CoA-binding protein [Actinomycetota bacterium]
MAGGGRHTPAMGFERFVGAQRIALVGASPRNLIVRITLDNLTRVGYPGMVIGVHPSGRSHGNLQVVPTLAEAGAELALLAIGAPRLPAAVREAGASGVGTVVIPG